VKRIFGLDGYAFRIRMRTGGGQIEPTRPKAVFLHYNTLAKGCLFWSEMPCEDRFLGMAGRRNDHAALSG